MTITQTKLLVLMVLAWAIVLPTLMILDYRNRPVFQEAPDVTVRRIEFNGRYGRNVTPVEWYNAHGSNIRRIPLNRYKR